MGCFPEDLTPEIVFSRLWEFDRKNFIIVCISVVSKDALCFLKGMKKKKKERNTIFKGQIVVSLRRADLPGTKSLSRLCFYLFYFL